MVSFLFSIFQFLKPFLPSLTFLRSSEDVSLWGGCEKKCKVNWVAWKVFLSTKEIRGLSVGLLISLNSPFSQNGYGISTQIGGHYGASYLMNS